ncbi:MAG TPA: DNA topoisomerase IB [Armatimonadota bacterium]|nr:DNA topoisomerase IB [Armatimonadota bacterium]
MEVGAEHPLHPDGTESARAAGLRYVSDEMPGIRREPKGEGFRYVRPDGTSVEDEKTLERIHSLAIPPAWTDVWICPRANGHIQATGRDAKGRKQYRYHPRWQEVRDETKYDRMLAFSQALPGIRARIREDLSQSKLSRERVLAAAVELLESTFIRVGNEEYTRQNASYGLTTLRNRHVDVRGETLRFHFRGKSGKEWRVKLRDRRLARVIRRLQELPGQELFQWVDESGERHSVSSADVNDYLREISGQDFTAKDFRTWAGTVLAFLALRQCAPPESEKQAKKNVAAAIRQVAEQLGNTPAVCRKCYVHPRVLEAYLDRDARHTLAECIPEQGLDTEGLHAEEAMVLRFLGLSGGAQAKAA